MVKRIWILLMICMILPLISSYACQDDTDDDYMPCEVITPYIDGICDATDRNTTVTMLNDTSLTANYSMSPVGDGTYNFSLNISDYLGYNNSLVGLSFSLVCCDNSTSIINIVQDVDEDMNLWIVIFIIFFLLLIAGFYYHGEAYIGNIFLFVAGCEMLLVGVWIFNEGISIYSISEFFIYPLAWIFVGMGIILTFYASFDMIHKEEKF